MSPRASATAHELTRVGLLAELPGETLAQLAKNMTREELPPGTTVFTEGEEADRFYVIVSGLVSMQQTGFGNRVLRPGDTFGEVSLALRIPRAGTARTMTPATLVWCDAECFDELIRPLFADDS